VLSLRNSFHSGRLGIGAPWRQRRLYLAFCTRMVQSSRPLLPRGLAVVMQFCHQSLLYRDYCDPEKHPMLCWIWTSTIADGQARVASLRAGSRHREGA